MDLDQTIVDALNSISDRQNTNHLEVVQRLTRVETRLDAIPPSAPLEERIRALEGWRAKTAGIIVAANVVFAGAIEWFHRR